MKKVEFKFQINDKMTTFDGREGTVEALCYGKEGIFYRLRMNSSLMDTNVNFYESELKSGWISQSPESA